MKKFEYLVVFMSHDRVHTANGHWQGNIPKGDEGDAASCPALFDYMSEAGAQGWEMVALDPEDQHTAQLYFKRER